MKAVTILALALIGMVAADGKYGRRRPHSGGDVDVSIPDIDIPDIHIPKPDFSFKGKWSRWGSWSTCSKECGRGEQKRTRTCEKPKHWFGRFRGCDGKTSETRHCNTHPCPINGNWGSWSSFGKCSKDCGGGFKTRSRRCDSPKPANGGRGCSGSSVDRMSCNTQGCPVDGGWSSWGSFGSCSKSCGGGVKTRDRTCTNPAPSNGGRTCQGPASEKMTCNEDVGCPVDGGWSSWGPFGKCSRSCGGGVKTRDRSCTKPRPLNGGKTCPGSAWDKMKCNTHPCHPKKKYY